MRSEFSQRCAATVGMAMAACLMSIALNASASNATQWVLSYQGKSTNQFIWDQRAAGLIRTRVPSKLSDHLLSALGGPPDALHVTGQRYVTVSACVPHDCLDQGFFWLDTQTGIGLGAGYVFGVLKLASNGLSAAAIPASAHKALADWLADHDLMPTSVEFIGRANQSTMLDAALFAPAARYRPAAGGPSFACSSAVSRSEHAICGDAALSELDLKLATLVGEMRHGFGTTVAETQLRDLQRAWLVSRDADCAAAPQLAACLAEQYRAQYTRLENWVPAR